MPTVTVPAATPTPIVEGNSKESVGIVHRMPRRLTGTWRIGGTRYRANAETQFSQEEGEFAVGTCVKVHYITNDERPVATQIQTVAKGQCGIDEVEQAAIGIVHRMPRRLTGTWRIGGTHYRANAETQFSQAEGEFAAGVCVKVHYIANNERPVATQIQTVSKSQCGIVIAEDEGEIRRYPRNLIGRWVIGGTRYVATSDTVFQQDEEAFDRGVHVNVKYYQDGRGQRVATSITSTDD